MGTKSLQKHSSPSIYYGAWELSWTCPFQHRPLFGICSWWPFSLFWENPISPLPVLVLLTHGNTSPATTSSSPAVVQFSEYAGPRRCNIEKAFCWFLSHLSQTPTFAQSQPFIIISNWCPHFSSHTSIYHILPFLQLSQRNHLSHWLGCHELFSA